MADGTVDREVADDGTVSFPTSRHIYRVGRPSHGRHPVTLYVDPDDGGARVQLHVDRVDLASDRSRREFAGHLNGSAEIVLKELRALFEDVQVEEEKPVRLVPDEHNGGYAVIDGQICGWRSHMIGGEYQPLCNFNAWITEEIIADDGLIERGEVTIAGELADGSALAPARVSVPKFGRMEWILPSWGTRAIVAAGPGNTDRLREAIQWLSPNVTRRREFVHSGWRKLPGGWAYLSAGSVINAKGPVAGVTVALQGAQERMVLPDPPTDDALRVAITATLAVLDVAPAHITAPLLGAVFRAPLNEARQADAGIILYGPTGSQKSELAAIAQQHFGAGFDRLNLPASWESTANALEAQASRFKDAVLTIDDYVPTGDTRDDRILNQKMGRVARGGGNHAGRGRMSADGSLRPDYQPRCQVIITAEDLPRGQSILARNTLLEVRRGDVNLYRLTAAQRHGRDGVFAATMAGYVQFLAARFDAIRADIAEQLASVRDSIRTESMHGRTPEAAAQWLVGWHYFGEFAESVGALSPDAAARLWTRVESAITGVARDQAEHHQAEDPVVRFLQGIEAALANGDAHVDGAFGDEPENPSAWGWERHTFGAGLSEVDRWTRRGSLIGWQRGEDLWLEPEAAFAVAQAMAIRTGSPISVQPKTLCKRMAERGLIISAEEGRNTIKQTLAGARRRVVLISVRHIYPDSPGQSGQPGRTPEKQAEIQEILEVTEPTPHRGIPLENRGNRGTPGLFPASQPKPATCVDCGDLLPAGYPYRCPICVGAAKAALEVVT